MTIFDGEGPGARRVSDLASVDRFVLLGEPGIGKSTVFTQAAADAGTEAVKARYFVEGDRPKGATVFIDALEEYSVGEAGRERIHDLIRELKASAYTRWRIACRSISLTPDIQAVLRERVGDFEVWQLDLLDPVERLKILESLGDEKPAELVARFEAMGSDQLLGNPASIRLLHQTYRNATRKLETRGELLAEATRQMALETNPGLVSDPRRPTADRITEAAETANLVMLLSVQEDLWSLPSSAPPADNMVSIEDLLPAGVDTQALRYALDSPMFRGEAGAYQASHRLVAEYLAGRALAHATAPTTPGRTALSLQRAIAFLTGDDDAPAPALTGIYAWFVTTLAETVHAPTALELVAAAPESLLFHGDPALLPIGHRRLLLDAVGRADPWFLRAARGSSAIGGLAGEDLSAELSAVLVNPDEGLQRRLMVLQALATGRRTSSLTPLLWTLATDLNEGEGIRREAAEAYLHQSDEDTPARRRLLHVLEQQHGSTAAVIRLQVMAPLVEAGLASVGEVRSAIVAYEQSDGEVMGYLSSLSHALASRPLWRLFNRPMAAAAHGGGARNFEVRSALDAILAATIRAHPAVSAARLLIWIEHRRVDAFDPVNDAVRRAVAEWLDREPGRDATLFWTLASRLGDAAVWRSTSRYQQLTGREPPTSVREAAVERLSEMEDLTGAEFELDLARSLICPWSEWPELYWRLWEILEARPSGAAAFKWLTQTDIDGDLAKHKAEMQDAAAKRDASEIRTVAWYTEHQDALRRGDHLNAQIWAAHVYLGYYYGARPQKHEAALVAVLGDDNAAAVQEGWTHISANFPISVPEQGAYAAAGQTPQVNYVVVAWAHEQLTRGLRPDLPLTSAFALLQSHFVLDVADDRERLLAWAVDEIASPSHAGEPLLAYWRAALAAGAAALPNLRELESAPSTGPNLATLLGEEPGLPSSALQGALSSAAQHLPPEELRRLVEQELASALPPDARRLWTLLAFAMDPAGSAPAFLREMDDPEGPQTLEGDLWATLLEACAVEGPPAIARSVVLIRRFGPSYPPSDAYERLEGRLSQLVAGSIEALARSPTREASSVLAQLSSSPDLPAWHAVLRHQASSQLSLRRQAEFRPPQARDIAIALAAGPPATAADLRAVIRECLLELRADIRHGDTSPWRGFWNRPHVNPPQNTPKVENDCRDLITDRLRDRLLRFNVPVARTSTEARSQADRRADVLVIGEGDAAVPIEAKRHWNRELWSAPRDQLLPYCETVGASGHGIYLVFWFGAEVHDTPPSPNSTKIISAEMLEAALKAHLSASEFTKIDVVVLDVSEPM